jgi:hypothetical protein
VGGLSLEAIGQHVGVSVATAQRDARSHNRLVVEGGEYARLAAHIFRQCLRDEYPGPVLEVPFPEAEDREV